MPKAYLTMILNTLYYSWIESCINQPTFTSKTKQHSSPKAHDTGKHMGIARGIQRPISIPTNFKLGV